MRIFDKLNPLSECVICGGKEEKPCTLIPIGNEGGVVEAKQAHIDCLELHLVMDDSLGGFWIAQRVLKKEG